MRVNGSHVVKRIGRMAKHPFQSVGTKLFAVFFVSNVVLVTAIGVWSYSVSKNVIEVKVADATQQTIVQTSRKLDLLYESFQNVSNQAIADSDLKLLLFQYYSAPPQSFERSDLQKQLVVKLNALTVGDAMYAVSLIDGNGNLVATTGSSPEHTVAEEAWYQQLSAAADGRVVWLETRKNGYFGAQGLPSFALGRQVLDGNGTVLLLEMKYSVLEQEMSDVKMGESGYTQIVSTDKTVLYDRDVSRLETTEPLSISMDGEQFSEIVDSGNGNRHLIVYQKSAVTGWYVVGALPTKELLAETRSIANLTVLMTIIAVLSACGIGYVVVLMIARPLRQLRNLMKEGENGNLSVHASMKSRDEIGQLAQSFNQMMRQISVLVQHIRRSAQEVLATSDELSDASRKTAQAAKEIAVATEEIASGASNLALDAERVNQLTNTIDDQVKQVVSSNAEMEQSAMQVRRSSELGITYMTELTAKSSSAEQMTRSMMEKVSKLQESTRDIRKILDMLNDITSQTNILSLNATIEAARAGAAGRGFLVVADEIRKLAEQSKRSIDVVGEITKSIQREINETVTALSAAYPIFQEQITSVKKTDAIFKEVNDHMAAFIRKLAETSQLILQLGDSQRVMSEAMSNVSAVAEQSSATSEEVASLSNEQLYLSEGLVRLSENLEKLSRTLQDSLLRFYLDSDVKEEAAS